MDGLERVRGAPAAPCVAPRQRGRGRRPGRRQAEQFVLLLICGRGRGASASLASIAPTSTAWNCLPQRTGTARRALCADRGQSSPARAARAEPATCAHHGASTLAPPSVVSAHHGAPSVVRELNCLPAPESAVAGVIFVTSSVHSAGQCVCEDVTCLHRHTQLGRRPVAVSVNVSVHVS